jgi:hypothetical protein
MTHLSSEQLVEAVEGTLSSECARHLDQCEACRDSLTTIRAVLADVGETPAVPEPSPLFWEHFSRRVQQATAAEQMPVRAAWWQGLWRPAAALAAVAGAIALAMLLRGGTGHPPAATVSSETAASATEPAVPDDTVEVVSAVVGDLSFDELRAADLVPSRGVVDQAVSSLTKEQQQELMRLVREEFMGSE